MAPPSFLVSLILEFVNINQDIKHLIFQLHLRREEETGREGRGETGGNVSELHPEENSKVLEYHF